MWQTANDSPIQSQQDQFQKNTPLVVIRTTMNLPGSSTSANKVEILNSAGETTKF